MLLLHVLFACLYYYYSWSSAGCCKRTCFAEVHGALATVKLRLNSYQNYFISLLTDLFIQLICLAPCTSSDPKG